MDDETKLAEDAFTLADALPALEGAPMPSKLSKIPPKATRSRLTGHPAESADEPGVGHGEKDLMVLAKPMPVLPSMHRTRARRPRKPKI